MRRIGVLIGLSESDPENEFLAIFFQELARLGWVEGRNMRTDPGDRARCADFLMRSNAFL